jgi:DNA-binding MurR/RpiR family transcriptional regulator
MAATRDQLPFRYRSTDTATGVSRATALRVAERLGVDETSMIHLAIRQMAQHVLPQYEADEGPLTPQQLQKARALVDQNRTATASLFEPATKPRRKART